MNYCYDYPRPAVTVDAVVFKQKDNTVQILLIRRNRDPYKNCWALPGGFVEMDESLDTAVARELSEETGLTDISLVQLYTFGNPGRDPRGRTISVAFVGICKTNTPIQGNDDAAEAHWFSIENLPELAFDHDLIIVKAIEWLKAKNTY